MLRRSKHIWLGHTAPLFNEARSDTLFVSLSQINSILFTLFV